MERATKSREVDLSRLKGFRFLFRTKNEEWRDFQLVAQITSESPRVYIGSTPTKTIERVCVSKSSKEQICLLCTEVITDKDFRRKLMISGGQKRPKLV